MRVLVTWGSKHGGTEGIAATVAAQLAAHGQTVVAEPAADVRTLDGIDAVVVGGALYANRWPGPLKRFVRRHTRALRRVPVWFFSSGPLDDSADRAPIPAPTEVAVLAERVGAKDHVTFGGRLAATAKGFPAEAMAKTHAGDWRNPERIRAWADAIATELPRAQPGHAVDHAAQAPALWIMTGALGWAITAALAHTALVFVGPTAAPITWGLAAPAVFAVLAWAYFGARGARAPLPTALGWAAMLLGLDAALALARDQGLARFGQLALWAPAVAVFLLAWAVGVVRSTMPWPKPAAGHR